MPIQCFIIVLVDEAEQVSNLLPEYMELLDLIETRVTLLVNFIEEKQNIDVGGSVREIFFVFIYPLHKFFLVAVRRYQRQLLQLIKEVLPRVPHEISVIMCLLVLRQVQIE